MSDVSTPLSPAATGLLGSLVRRRLSGERPRSRPLYRADLEQLVAVAASTRPADEIPSEVADQVVDVALALASGRSESWTAVDHVRIPAGARFSSPLLTALVRLASLDVWPFVTAEGYDALRYARHRRLGYASVVVAEARLLSEARPSLRPVREALAFALLVDRLYPHEPLVPEILIPAYAALASVHLALGELPEAQEALARAAAHTNRPGAVSSPATPARLLHVRAALAERQGETEEALRLSRESLGMLRGLRPRHHLEVAVDVAAFHTRQGRVDEGVAVLTDALGLLAPLRTPGDPPRRRTSPQDRVHALYLSVQCLTAALAEGVGGDRVPGVVAALGGDLGRDDNRLLFQAFGMLPRALHPFLLGQLQMLYDLPAAAKNLRKARQRFTELGETALAEQASALLTQGLATPVPPPPMPARTELESLWHLVKTKAARPARKGTS